MESCIRCGQPTNLTIGGIGRICMPCYKEQRREKILERSESVKTCSDFKEWNGGDLSELFWFHLGKYVKEPNEQSAQMMRLAVTWARHADHGLSNSFDHALQWANVDPWKDRR